jgi:hypothetical protein
MMCYHLWSSAVALRLGGEARFWALEMFEEADRLGNDTALLTGSFEGAVFLIEEGEIDRALISCIKTATCQHALRISRGMDDSLDVFSCDWHEMLALLTPDQRRNAELFAAPYGIAPALIRVLAVSLQDSHAADSELGKVLAALKRNLSFTPMSGIFRDAGNAIEQYFSSGITSDDLVRIGNTFENGTVKLIYYVLSMLRSGTAERAFRVHGAILPFLEEYYNPFPGILDLFVAPYLRAYWMAKTREEKGLFYLSERLHSRLDQMEMSTPRAILGAVGKEIVV